MRVISQDKTVNVQYEGNMFCVINDEEEKEYLVAVRNNNLTGFMPLATYQTKQEAQTAFDSLIDAGETFNGHNSAFKF